jgi:predicted lipoprotein with Yx(FWY)xxD motif
MKFAALFVVGLLAAGCVNGYGTTAPGGYSATPAATTTGTILTGKNDMTLYVFDMDTPNTSNCGAACTVKWPPFVASTAAAGTRPDLTIITRADRTLQWAKDGQPLYYWAGDKAPGDTKGDGIGGVWHIARS